MPIKNYTIALAKNIECVVEFVTTKGIVIGFVVRLRVRVGKCWHEIRRYDTAHGVPHIDLLARDGEATEKIWLGQLSMDAALDFAVQDIKQNHLLYARKFTI
jgi:hypothetical protein